jgi:hypothetical protein
LAFEEIIFLAWGFLLPPPVNGGALEDSRGYKIRGFGIFGFSRVREDFLPFFTHFLLIFLARRRYIRNL